jgi:hypothetical protein
LRWQRPDLFMPEGVTRISALDAHRGQRLDAAAIGASVLAEADLLGVTATGALSILGHALHDNDPAALATATTSLLPTTRTVRIQADHTVVATGMPAPDLEQLLDACAEPETRGHSHTWRITAASIRGYFDAGHGSAQQLLARLEEVVLGGIPQPVRYLVGDVDRRYGHLTITIGVTVIHTDDPILLTQVCADRAVITLAPQQIAPTVLVCAVRPDKVTSVLRAAGYAPTIHNATGQTVIELTDHAGLGNAMIETPVSVQDEAAGGVRVTADADTEWIERLAARDDDREPSLTGAAAEIHRQAPELGAGDCQILAAAVADRSPIVIECTAASGPATATLRRPVLIGDHLVNLTTAGDTRRGEGHRLHELRMVQALPIRGQRRSPTRALEEG